MKSALVLATLFCFLLPAACLAGSDPVVAEVGGERIRLSQVEAEMTTTDVMYGFLGQNLSEDEIRAKKRAARLEILDQLIDRQVLLNQIEARGLRLEGEIKVAADQKYEASLDAVRAYVLKSYPSLAEDELEAQIDTILKAAGETRDSLKSAADEAALTEALFEGVYAECGAVSEEEMLARYEALYAAQVRAFASANDYEAALLAGEIIVHRPVDVKLIQKAEFLFDREIIPLITQMKLYGKASDAQAMIDDQYALLTEKVENVYESLIAGDTTFDQVLEAIEPGGSEKVNYFSAGSTRFTEDYSSRALAFSTVGEISTVYRIENGYALLRYAGDLPACDRVPVSQVREAIEAQLLAEARQTHLEAAIEKWTADAGIVRFEENLP